MAEWKVLIVEDDALVRVALKTLINWEEQGFTLVGEAEDGQIALGMIQQLNPDIVLLDMQMPVLDGMGVLKELQGNPHPPKVVILSSHDDFELVKEAMKLGAEDYLLKLNMDFSSLVQVLERVVAQIGEEEGQKREERDYDQQFHRNLDAMRKNFFENMIGGLYQGQEEIKKNIHFLELDFLKDQIYCFVVYIESLALSEEREEDVVKRFAVTNVIQEIIGGYCFEWNGGEFVAFISDDTMTREKLRINGKRVVDMLYEYISLNSVVGIAVSENGVLEIRKAYHEASESVYNRYFFEDQKVFLWDEKRHEVITPEDYNVFCYKAELYRGLNLHSKEVIEQVLYSITKDVQRKALTKEQICKAVLYVYYMIAEFCHSNGLEVRTLLLEEQFQYEELIRIRNLSVALEKLEAMKLLLLKYCDTEDVISGGKKIIEKAMEYMEHHYSEEISLGDVADHVALNASYLSNLMKKNYGKSYSEILIDLRIRKAKQLIHDTDYKVYLISEMVGYPNTFYFNRLFKNRTGMTPMEYKNQ